MSAAITQTTITVNAQSTVVEGDSSSTVALKTTTVPAAGTSAGQADLVYKKTRTVTNSGTPLDLDLTSLNWNGSDSASAAAKIVTIYIKNSDAAQKLTVGLGTNPFTAWMAGTTPTMDVGKSSKLYRDNPVDGWTVDSSHKILRIATDSSGAHNFDIYILARSA